MKLSCRAFNGHTHLTHSYILRKDPPPQCEHHQCVLTVYHFGVVQSFWWSAIIFLKKGKIYLVKEMWWNHLDSTLYSYYSIQKIVISYQKI